MQPTLDIDLNFAPCCCHRWLWIASPNGWRVGLGMNDLSLQPPRDGAGEIDGWNNLTERCSHCLDSEFRYINLPVTCGLDDNRRANRLVVIAAVVFMILSMCINESSASRKIYENWFMWTNSNMQMRNVCRGRIQIFSFGTPTHSSLFCIKIFSFWKPFFCVGLQ